MSTLEELRAQIDDIDAQMVALFEQRMNVTRQVGEYKKEHGMPVLDRGREAEVLAKKESMLKNPYLKTEVKDFFSSIMAIPAVSSAHCWHSRAVWNRCALCRRWCKTPGSR